LTGWSRPCRRASRALHLGALARGAASCNVVFRRTSWTSGESGAGDVCELAYRRGGFVTFRSVPEMPEALAGFLAAGFCNSAR